MNQNLLLVSFMGNSYTEFTDFFSSLVQMLHNIFTIGYFSLTVLI